MLEIYPDTRVFIIAAAGSITGGPESLHQLGGKLREKGIDARMFYSGGEDVSAVKEAYSKYGIATAEHVEDSPRNIMVVPETLTRDLYQYKRIRKVIWWLSLDYFFRRRKEYDLKSALGIYWFKRKFNLNPRFAFERNSGIFHLYLTEYVREFLQSQGITANLAELEAPISKEFYEAGALEVQKHDWVAYNPRKGFEFVNQIIEQSDFSFKPVDGLSREGVCDLLRQCKVYIDFGHFPGRERIVKEAVISGCCAILGKRGSAGNAIDHPIPAEYKFDNDPAQIPAIIDKISRCLKEYDSRIAHFEPYRQKIRDLVPGFDAAVDRIFVRRG